MIFWRGVWHTADALEKSNDSSGLLAILFSGPVSLVISMAILLLTGLFVSVFIGDKIIISGLKQEKKLLTKPSRKSGEKATCL